MLSDHGMYQSNNSTWEAAEYCGDNSRYIPTYCRLVLKLEIRKTFLLLVKATISPISGSILPVDSYDNFQRDLVSNRSEFSVASSKYNKYEIQ